MNEIFVLCFLAASLVGLLFCALMLIRNECVYRVRMAFIDHDDFPTSFHCLPKYDEMMYSVRHFNKWTYRQWSEWLEQRVQQMRCDGAI